MEGRTRWVLPAVILVAAGSVAALMIFLRPDPPRAEPPSGAPAVTTRPADVRSGAIDVVGSGTVRPRAEIDLAARVSGRVEYVAPNLVSGGRVRAGQLLVQLDSADYANAVRQARAEVAQQEVALIQAEEEAEIARDEYERFLARQRALGLEPPDTTPSRLVFREPQLDAARAALERARARLADAELALERTRVRAPFEGVVRSETVDLGSFVSPGQGLARIFASDEVEVVLALSDGDAALIPGLFTLEAGDGDRSVPATVFGRFGAGAYRWRAYIDRAEGALDERSRTIDVVVRVPDPFRGGQRTAAGPDGGGWASAEADTGGVPVPIRAAPDDPPPLLVGQFVDVRIEGRSLERYAIVPRSALRPGDRVWAVRPDSTVRIVPVRVLQSEDERVYVVGELEDGEPVVTGGTRIATEGMEVRPVDPVASDTAAAPAPDTAAAAGDDAPGDDR